jgi:hypothetical protein
MSAKTDVIRRGEIEKCKSSLRKDVTLAIQQVNELSSSILLDDCLHTIGWNDSFRALLTGLQNSEPSYRSLLLNSVYKINQECSLGVPLYLTAVEYMLGERDGSDFEEILSYIETPQRVSSAKIIEEWSKTIHDELTTINKSLFLEAVQAAGSLGAVIIQRTDSASRIQIEKGSKFSCSPHPFFDSKQFSNIEFEKCLVVVVDGAIIDVSEIHHLLTYSYEQKTPFIIVASNYSDDVANTLRVNWEKNLVNVLPLLFSKELEDINQVKDLCQVTNAVPVSKDTGVLVSTIDFKGMPLSTARYSGLKLELTIETTANNFSAIRLLRKEIQDNIQKEKVDDIKSALRSRLSRLATRKAIIKINCRENEAGILQDRAGGLMQLLSCAGRQGVVSLEPIYKKIGCTDTKYMPTILPRTTTEIAVRRAISDVRAINKIMAIIKLD